MSQQPTLQYCNPGKLPCNQPSDILPSTGLVAGSQHFEKASVLSAGARDLFQERVVLEGVCHIISLHTQL